MAGKHSESVPCLFSSGGPRAGTPHTHQMVLNGAFTGVCNGSVLKVTKVKVNEGGLWKSSVGCLSF